MRFGSKVIVSSFGLRLMMNLAVWSPAVYSSGSLPDSGFDGCGTWPKFERSRNSAPSSSAHFGNASMPAIVKPGL